MVGWLVGPLKPTGMNLGVVELASPVLSLFIEILDDELSDFLVLSCGEILAEEVLAIGWERSECKICPFKFP